MKIELSHDILARKIYDKSSSEDKLILKIEGLVREEYQRFVDRKVLMGIEDYEYVAPFLNSLNVSSQELAFIEKSKRAIERDKRNRNLFIIGIIALLTFLGAFATYQTVVAQKHEREALKQAELAEQEKRAAIDARAEADALRKAAEMSAEKATNSAREAERQAIIAERQRQIAVIKEREAREQTIIAQQQKERALVARTESDRLKIIAEDNAIEAKRNAIDAEVNAKEAKRNADLATENELKAFASAKKANELKELSEARVKANNAIRLILEGKLLEGASLAVEANKQNKAAGGPTQNSDCYQALDFAYQAFVQEEIDKKGNKELEPFFQTRDAAIRCVATAYDTNNKEITAYATEDKNLFVITDKGVEQLSLQDRPRSITFSHKGNLLLIGTANGKLLVFERNNGIFEKRRMDLNTDNGSIGYVNAFSLNKNDYYIAYADNSALHIGSILPNPKRSTNLIFNPTQRISLKNIQSASFSADGKYTLIANHNEFQVHEINYNASSQAIENIKIVEIGELKGLKVTATAIGKNQNDYLLALGLKNGYVNMATLSNLSCLTQTKNCPYNIQSQHRSAITKLIFRADGKQLITTSLDKTARIWSIENFDDERIPLVSHRKWIWDVAYSQDQSTIYTVSEDRSIRLWLSNVETLEDRIDKYIFLNRRSNDSDTKGFRSIEDGNN